MGMVATAIDMVELHLTRRRHAGARNDGECFVSSCFETPAWDDAFDGTPIVLLGDSVPAVT